MRSRMLCRYLFNIYWHRTTAPFHQDSLDLESMHPSSCLHDSLGMYRGGPLPSHFQASGTQQRAQSCVCLVALSVREGLQILGHSSNRETSFSSPPLDSEPPSGVQWKESYAGSGPKPWVAVLPGRSHGDAMTLHGEEEDPAKPAIQAFQLKTQEG